MTITFKVFVLHLLAEFLAHTFVFGQFTHLAGAISVFLAQAFADFFNHSFIVV